MYLIFLIPVYVKLGCRGFNITLNCSHAFLRFGIYEFCSIDSFVILITFICVTITMKWNLILICNFVITLRINQYLYVLLVYLSFDVIMKFIVVDNKCPRVADCFSLLSLKCKHKCVSFWEMHVGVSLLQLRCGKLMFNG